MNGLSTEEVNERIKNKQINIVNNVKTKSIVQIISENVFTLFNFLNIGLALLVLFTSSYKNLLFMGVVICNTVISTFQMIRSKLIIDKLTIINTNKVNALRNGVITNIDINEIVLDDVLIYKMGNQIITDGILIEGSVDVNNSYITGESELVHLDKNDLILSGSFISSGTCKVKVTHVGSDNYTSIITKGSKYIKKINSTLMNSLNSIIKIVSIIIVPMGLLLFYNQYMLNGFNESILNTVAALISMIPEGLILLTSTVLAVSIIKLSKRNVLAQELFCVEMLSRVDTICLDKTGTITTGKMVVDKVIPLTNNALEIIGNIVNYIDDDNETMISIKKYFKKQKTYHFKEKIPFSSVKKYSGVIFEEGKFLIGAPEFVYNKEIKDLKHYQKDYRTLLVVGKKPIAIILIKDEIRLSSKKTINYLTKEGVDIKIISGDNIDTINNIASKLKLSVNSIDISNIELNDDIVLNHNVFARVSPIQKKQIVEILQNNKRVVAMTGDGVNDVLALKQADCSISFKSATDAARNISQIILLDNSFDSVPKIIEEGRQTINNIERSASLYLSKTCYASLLTLLFIFVNLTYPFKPIQLTLMNFFTIGLPSIVLALEPNSERIKGNFLKNIFKNSLPSGITVFLNILFISIIGNYLLDYNQISTLCLIMTTFVGFLLIFKLCIPFNKLRICLITTLLTVFILISIIFKDLFYLTNINLIMFIVIIIMIIFSIVVFNLINKIIDKEHFKKSK